MLFAASYTLFEEDELLSDEDEESMLEELSTDEDDFFSLDDGLFKDEDISLLEELDSSVSGLIRDSLESSFPQDENNIKTINKILTIISLVETQVKNQKLKS